MKKVIIVGGGIAGLTAGIYAKLHDYDVEIYEKNHEAGGLLTSWRRDGNIIDGCLHWMLGTKEGTNLNAIWKTVGGLDGVEIIHPNSFYEAIFEGKKLVLYRDAQKLHEELLSHCESENDQTLVNALIDAITTMGESVMQSDTPFELNPKLAPPKMSLMRKLRPFLNMRVEDLANAFDSKIIRYALENSLVDKRFSVHYFLQTLSNFVIDNASLPLGGSHHVRNKMVEKFTALGGEIIYRAHVQEIITEGSVAKGIIVNDEEKRADYVIAACDTHHTFQNLLKNKYGNPYQAYDEQKTEYPTYSFIIASFKTKRSFKNEEIASVYKVKAYSLFNKSYDVMSVRQYGYDKEFIHDGYTTVCVMLPTYEEDYEYLKGLSKEEYKTFKKQFADIYKTRLEEIYQEEFIVIDTLTPLTYERFVNAYKGAFMTYAIGARKPQGLHGMLVDGLDNLILANQWLVMPGGTPMAIIHGKFAAQLLLHKDGRDYTIEN